MNAGARHFRTVPECLAKLRDKPRWVGWRWENRENKMGEAVPTKPPFQADGTYAHNDKPKTWSTLGEIEAVMQVHRFDGVSQGRCGQRVGCRDVHIRDG